MRSKNSFAPAQPRSGPARWQNSSSIQDATNFDSCLSLANCRRCQFPFEVTNRAERKFNCGATLQQTADYNTLIELQGQNSNRPCERTGPVSSVALPA